MAKKITAKEAGLMLLLGAGVLLFTPMLSGLFGGIAFLQKSIIAGLSIGSLLAAGVVVFALSYVIEKYLK